MSDQYDAIKIDESDLPIANIIMNRPDTENAMGQESFGHLSEILNTLSERDDVHVIVIRSGGNHFHAGADIDEMLGDRFDAESWRDHFESGTGYAAGPVRAMLEAKQPIITRIHGSAIGAGAGIATFADIPIAANNARIGDLHTVMGVNAPNTPGLWPTLTSTNKAKELIMRGEMISGEEAERLGLVNHAVPEDELDEKIDEIATDLATGSQYAIRATKRVINRQQQESMLRSGTESWGIEAFTAQLGDFEAAVRSMMENRDPSEIEYPSAQHE